MAKTGKNDPAALSALPAGASVTAPRSEGPRPSRKARGLPLTRRVTHESATAGEVLNSVEWTRRPAKISGADGEVVFKMDDAEVPAGWSQLATDVAVSKYFRKAGVPTGSGAEESVRHLVRRYLEGFGPASVDDIAQFSTILKPPIKAALTELAGELVVHAGPRAEVLFDLPGRELPDEDVPAPPRLLPMWDSTLLAYADRARVIPGGHRKLVMRNNGDVLPALLVDGFVAGVWRVLDGAIEASAFEPLSAEAWTGVEAEAGELLAFLRLRDPAIYRRYAHWWDDLPAAEVRRFG